MAESKSARVSGLADWPELDQNGLSVSRPSATLSEIRSRSVCSSSSSVAKTPPQTISNGADESCSAMSARESALRAGLHPEKLFEGCRRPDGALATPRILSPGDLSDGLRSTGGGSHFTSFLLVLRNLQLALRLPLFLFRSEPYGGRFGCPACAGGSFRHKGILPRQSNLR